jgi:hypothetical protein
MREGHGRRISPAKNLDAGATTETNSSFTDFAAHTFTTTHRTPVASVRFMFLTRRRSDKINWRRSMYSWGFHAASPQPSPPPPPPLSYDLLPEAANH